MKILHFHKNEAKLVVENIDDLWQLSTIISEGDTLEGRTFRKIKLGTAEERSQKITKKPVFLKIGIEKVEFHRYSDILRVSGKVLEGKDDIPKGSYHTFNIEEGTTITIIKPEWLKYERQKLKQAAKEKKTDTLICVFDREEAYIVLMKKYGFDILTTLKGDIAKKAEVSQPVKNFYDELIKALQEYVKRYSIKQVILASPAFWKDELLKNLKDNELKEKITLATCSSCDKSAINEVLKRPEVQTVLQQDRIAAEMKIVDELLSEISKQGAAAYGVEETDAAVQAGAAKTLLVTDSLIQRTRQEDSFEKINKMMKSADRTGADIHIISSDHEGGKKLDGLGGIAAILRYKMNY